MKKNVLIVVSDLLKGSGRQERTAEIGNKLRERGHKVVCFTIYDVRDRIEFAGKTISLGKEKKTYPMEFTIDIFKTAIQIKHICKNENIDTILCFGIQGNLSAILSRMLFGTKSKVIVSVRNDVRLLNALGNSQIKWLYPKADHVVAVSKGVEYNLKKQYGLKNTTTIYNIHIQDFHMIDRQAALEIEEKHNELYDYGFVFINVGRPSKQKGHWNLIRSFKRVSDVRNNCKLLILGDGELMDDLNLFIKNIGLEDKVTLLGRIDNVFPYLRKSDCFVFSSYFEGFPSVLTEALSQDLPVISTDCNSGPREILCPGLPIESDIDYPYCGEYGILTKPFNDRLHFKTIDEKPLTEEERTFAEMMIKMMDDDQMRRKYSKGRERLENEEFELDYLIKEWEKLL